MKHFHPDDELAIVPLNCFETTTAALNVCHKICGFDRDVITSHAACWSDKMNLSRAK
jgi:hypothetical protein